MVLHCYPVSTVSRFHSSLMLVLFRKYLASNARIKGWQMISSSAQVLLKGGIVISWDKISSKQKVPWNLRPASVNLRKHNLKVHLSKIWGPLLSEVSLPCCHSNGYEKNEKNKKNTSVAQGARSALIRLKVTPWGMPLDRWCLKSSNKAYRLCWEGDLLELIPLGKWDLCYKLMMLKCW